MKLEFDSQISASAATVFRSFISGDRRTSQRINLFNKYVPKCNVIPTSVIEGKVPRKNSFSLI